jgi:regulator of replication initiation timing
MNEFDMRLLIEELQERNDNLNKENNELSLENQRLYNILDKIKEIVNEAPCLWYVDEEIERVDGTIDLSYEEYIGWKDILELLEEIE